MDAEEDGTAVSIATLEDATGVDSTVEETTVSVSVSLAVGVLEAVTVVPDASVDDAVTVAASDSETGVLEAVTVADSDSDSGSGSNPNSRRRPQRQRDAALTSRVRCDSRCEMRVVDFIF